MSQQVGSGTRTIRKVTRQEQVARDIMKQIQAGQLAPGDRLTPVRTLRSVYGVSQSVLNAALSDLVRRGILATRMRSGCFVTDDAWSLVGGHREAPAVSSPGIARPSVTGSGVRTMTIFVSDTLPSVVAFWEEALKVFQKRLGDVKCRLLFNRDGQIEAFLARHPADIVQGTPNVLQRIGREQFIKLDAMMGQFCNPAEFLPLVRERLAQDEPVIGLPFSVTLRYLYVNQDLLAQSGLPCRAPKSVLGMLDQAKAFEARLKLKGCYGMVTFGIADLLIHSGAVQRDSSGRIQFDTARATACLKALVAGRFTPVFSGDVVPLFTAGKLLYFMHNSWTAIEMKERAAFKWRAFPPLCDPGGHVPGYLTVLGINRRTPFPDECMDFLRYAVSTTVQKGYAALGGNLPVLSSVVSDRKVLSRIPVEAATLRGALSANSLLWPEDFSTEIGRRCQVEGEDLDVALLRGGLAVEAAVDHLRASLDNWKL